MPSARVRTMAFVLVGAFALGSTAALDSDTGAFVATVRLALEAPPDTSLCIGDVCFGSVESDTHAYRPPAKNVEPPIWSAALNLVEYLLVPFVVFGLIGGLPVALFALALRHVRRLRALRERVLADHSRCYAGLLFQVVSMIVSAFLLLVFLSTVPSLRDVRDGGLFLGYFGAQLLAGGLALPAWRALLNRAVEYRDVAFMRLVA